MSAAARGDDGPGEPLGSSCPPHAIAHHLSLSRVLSEPSLSRQSSASSAELPSPMVDRLGSSDFCDRDTSRHSTSSVDSTPAARRAKACRTLGIEANSEMGSGSASKKHSFVRWSQQCRPGEIPTPKTNEKGMWHVDSRCTYRQCFGLG